MSIEDGDRVRVQLDVEGEVTYINTDGSVDIAFGEGKEITCFPVEFVTVLPKPPKVGGAVRKEDADTLPIASVIEDERQNHYFRTYDGWRWAGQGGEIGLPDRPLTLAYLP